MKYEKIFESSILDEMFYSRSDGFETENIKIRGKFNCIDKKTCDRW